MSNDIQDKNPNTKQNTNNKCSIDFWIAEPVLDTWGQKVFYILRSWWLCVTIVVALVKIIDISTNIVQNNFSFWGGFGISFVINIILAMIVAYIILKISQTLIDKKLLTNKWIIRGLIGAFFISSVYLATINTYKSDYIQCYHLATQKIEMNKYCKDIATGWHTKVLFLK